jgi:hypothetical protein
MEQQDGETKDKLYICNRVLFCRVNTNEQYKTCVHGKPHKPECPDYITGKEDHKDCPSRAIDCVYSPIKGKVCLEI